MAELRAFMAAQWRRSRAFKERPSFKTRWPCPFGKLSILGPKGRWQTCVCLARRFAAGLSVIEKLTGRGRMCRTCIIVAIAVLLLHFGCDHSMARAQGEAAMVMKEHDGLVHDLAFSSDDARLLLAVGTGMVSDGGDWKGEIKLWEILWKTRTREMKATLSGGFYVNSVAFCPRGRFLAAGGSRVRGGDPNTHEGQVGLWDMRRGAEQATIKGYRAGVLSMAFSPDGTILATGGGAPDRQRKFVGEVKLWHVETSREPSALKGGLLDNGMVYSVGYAPDGATLAVGGGYLSTNGTRMRGAVELWDLGSGKVRAELRGIAASDELGHSDGANQVSSLAFSPDGETLATGLQDGGVKLWNAATLEERATLKGHSAGGMVSAVAFSPSGALLASAARDGTVKLWHVSNGEQKATLHGGVFLSVAFSPDGKLLAAGSVDGTVRLWSVADLPTQHSQNENGLP